MINVEVRGVVGGVKLIDSQLPPTFPMSVETDMLTIYPITTKSLMNVGYTFLIVISTILFWGNAWI